MIYKVPLMLAPQPWHSKLYFDSNARVAAVGWSVFGASVPQLAQKMSSSSRRAPQTEHLVSVSGTGNQGQGDKGTRGQGNYGGASAGISGGEL